jgi:hypothetical protein
VITDEHNKDYYQNVVLAPQPRTLEPGTSPITVRRKDSSFAATFISCRKRRTNSCGSTLPNSRRVVNTILDKWPARDRGSGAFSNRHATRIDTKMSIDGSEKRRGYPSFAGAPHQVADNLVSLDTVPFLKVPIHRRGVGRASLRELGPNGVDGRTAGRHADGGNNRDHFIDHTKDEFSSAGGGLDLPDVAPHQAGDGPDRSEHQPFLPHLAFNDRGVPSVETGTGHGCIEQLNACAF